VADGPAGQAQESDYGQNENGVRQAIPRRRRACQGQSPLHKPRAACRDHGRHRSPFVLLPLSQAEAL